MSLSKLSSSLLLALLLLNTLALVTHTRSNAAEATATTSTRRIGAYGTSTIFSEDFEGPFPAPNWLVSDANSANGYDFWDDTSVKSHGGSWSGWCADEGTQYLNYTVWTENFEGEFPTSDYQVVDFDPPSGYDCWDNTSYRYHGGSWSAWCAQNGTQYDALPEIVYNWEVHRYDNDMWTNILRWADLTSYSFATFSFWYWIDSELGADSLQVVYHTSEQPGGVNTYINIASGNSSGWTYKEVSIPANAVWVMLGFSSNSVNKDFEGAYVDDIALTGIVEVSNTSMNQYDDNMMSYMYRSVDMSAYFHATLSYWYWIDCESGYDYLQVAYHNGTGWFYVDTHSGSSSGWQYSEATIPGGADDVGFYFRSDFSIHAYEGAYVDDVLLVGTEKPGILRGTISELGTGTPIADAYVIVGSQNTYTSALGYYEFELEAGVYDIIVYRTYYYSIFIESVSVLPNTDTIQDIMLTPGYSVVTNGGFESGDLAGWASYGTLNYPIEPLPNVTVTNADARSGTYSLKLMGQAHVVQVYNQPALLKGNLFFWAKCLDEGVTSGISIAVMTDPAVNPITMTFPVGDTWTKFMIPIPEAAQWIQVEFATYLPDSPESGVNPEPKLIDDVWIGYEPLVESCDQLGAIKNSYDSSDTVYVFGSGYAHTFLCVIYVVEDVVWTDGMTIPLGAGTLTTTFSNSTGDFNTVPVYYPPLAPGKYDTIVDVNDNGKYDAGIDALDDNDIEITAGLVIPEFSQLLLALAFVMAISLLSAVKNERKPCEETRELYPNKITKGANCLDSES